MKILSMIVFVFCISACASACDEAGSPDGAAAKADGGAASDSN